MASPRSLAIFSADSPISNARRARSRSSSRERRVGAAFIAAAENDHQRTGKGFDGFDRGVDVGGFGIVVILHAGNFGDEFEAMFDAAKTFHSGGDGGGDGSGEIGGGAGGQNIFDVVLAAKLNVARGGRAPLPSLRGGK